MRSLADEVPFDIPDSWEWVRISSISKVVTKGTTPRGGNVAYSNKGIGFLRAENVAGLDRLDLSNLNYIDEATHTGFLKRSILQADDVLITIAGTLGRTAIVKAYNLPLNANQAVAIIRLISSDCVDLQYLVYALNAPSIQDKLTAQKKITAIPNLTLEIISDCLIPIPPLEEQHRIVDYFARFTPRIEEYAAKQTELNTLNDSFPELLKKSILQEAVQGKLVPQDPSDEPASVLLERIRAEKEQLIKTGKIRRDKHESVIFRRDNSHYEKLDGIERCIDDELPFEIPENWCWVRFGTAITLLSGTDFAPDEYNSTGKGIAYITGASNIADSQILVNRWTETPRQIAYAGDILLVCKGSGYGKTVICNIAQAHIARQIMAVRKSDLLDMQYIKLFLDSSFDILKTKGQGVIPGIDRISVLQLLFPLPPLDEQHRIVQRIEELLLLVKGL